MISLSPVSRFRLRLAILGLFLVVKTFGSLYWLTRPDWVPSLVMVSDLVTAMLLMWVRHRWLRTSSPYQVHIKAFTVGALFTQVLLHNYHAIYLGYQPTDFYFIPVMVAAFDFGVWGGVVAGLGGLGSLLALSLVPAFDPVYSSRATMIVHHAVLYGGISWVTGRLAEEALSDRERYRIIVAESLHPIVQVDRKGRVTLFNRAAETAAGKAAEQLLGRPVWEAVYRSTKYQPDGSHTSPITRALELEKEERALMHKVVLDGRERFFLVDTYLIRSPIGRVTGAFAIHKDITEMKRQEEALRQANEKLQQLTITDPLTGVGNRRLLDRELEREWKRSVRTGRPLSLIMIDIDHFKQINDTWGHVVGDETLKAVANQVLGAVRDTDSVFRFGGEELAVLLPETATQAAAEVAERIRVAVQRHVFRVEGHDLSCTVSLGVGATGGQPLPDAAALVALVDRSMYEAKRNGRNRVCVAA